MADPSLFSAFASPIRAALVAEGFRGSSTVFRRRSSDVTHLIQLQRSRHPGVAALKVTVNLAVWVNVLAPIRAGRPDLPSEIAAHWRERVGFLMQPPSDHWWSVSTVAQAKLAGAQASSLIISLVMPVFQTLPNANAVLNCWRSGTSPGLTEFQRVKLLARLEHALARGA